jgi:transcriptional regulator with XRE-family HTH domain
MRKNKPHFIRALGAAVRARRLVLRLTEDRLARRMGVSEKIVRQIEAGRHNVTVLLLQILARALELSIADLLRRAQKRLKAEQRLK